MNDAIFLSASIPEAGRGEYFKTADRFLIQLAVREFLFASLGRRKIVWGGHPSITPMVLAACKDLNVDISQAVTLYQSTFFSGSYPKDNENFSSIEYIEHTPNNLKESLLNMRTAMISRKDISSAVFIGGMDGIFSEYDIFIKAHPNGIVLPIGGPGGAARELATKLGFCESMVNELNFSKLFYEHLNIDFKSPRTTIIKQ
ncbi:hypothetical protein [Aeromonas veronii]|uniref:SLOG domain-containing protein n=1 Tax=Aeromonas TaxID=642 RepID=UPI001F2EDFC3|nr:hypothetical protein [Aeromonas veronii]MCF5894763.1 hypothetical protein [Aeromonas veronii]